VPHPAVPAHSWVPFALFAAVALPILVAAVVLAARGWWTSGEFAQAELRMRDFWSHPPQLGAVGRLRTATEVSSHPGPAAWWLLYPVYVLLGRSPVALSTAVALMAVGWMAASIWLVWRRGGTGPAVIIAAVFTLAVRALGSAAFVEPWNPWFGIFPFAFFVLAVWDVLCGHRWTLPAAAAAGSFCVQAHVGYAPLAALLLLAPVGTVAWSARRAEVRRSALGVLAVTTAVLAVMWLPPVVQQLTNDPGNMSVLVEAYGDQTGPPVGVTDALGVVGGRLDPGGPWIVHDDGQPQERAVGPGTVALLVVWAVAAGVALARRNRPRWRPVLVLHVVCAATVVVSVVVVSRIIGPVFDYLVPWLSVVTALVVAVIAWTGWAWIDDRWGRDGSDPRPGVRRGAALAGVAVLVGALGWTTAQFARVDTPAGDLSATVGDLAPRVAATLDPGGRYVLRWEDPRTFGGAGFGLLADLERRGFDVGADDAYHVEVGRHRVMDAGTADAAVWVVTGAGIDRWRATPGVEEIGAFDPRSDAQRRAAERLRDGLRVDLAAIGGQTLADQLDTNYWVTRSDARVPASLRRRIDEWAALGAPTAVFLADPRTTSAA